MHYTATFKTGCKNGQFSYDFFYIFFLFLPLHRLRVHVKTRPSSNLYPQSMFLSKNKKNVYACKPTFYNTKVECKIKNHADMLYSCGMTDSVQGFQYLLFVCRVLFQFQGNRGLIFDERICIPLSLPEHCRVTDESQ